jgi:predicted signal transduction protein with EAL and GGDEF domain
MKSEQNFAMGHAFSAKDLFHNFPIDKLKMDYNTVRSIYSDGDKRSLSASIFAKGMQLIVEDIIENNVHFLLPTLGSNESYLYMKKVSGNDFKKAVKNGKWRDVDFLTSNFSGYQLAMSVKSTKRPEKEKSIYLGYKHKDRITELTNEGKRY